MTNLQTAVHMFKTNKVWFITFSRCCYLGGGVVSIGYRKPNGAIGACRFNFSKGVK